MKFVKIVMPDTPLDGLRAEPSLDKEPVLGAQLYRLLETRGFFRAGDFVWLTRHQVGTLTYEIPAAGQATPAPVVPASTIFPPIFRIDCTDTLERAAQRRARALRIRIACELGAGLACWALASFLWGQAGFFGAGFALVAAVSFTVALQAVEGGTR